MDSTTGITGEPKALATVATSVNLQGAKPWHLSKPFRNGVLVLPIESKKGKEDKEAHLPFLSSLPFLLPRHWAICHISYEIWRMAYGQFTETAVHTQRLPTRRPPA